VSFYLLIDNKKVMMKELQGEVINLETLDKLQQVKKSNFELKVYSDDISINHKHLNYRFASILKPQRNTVLTEFSSIESSKFVTHFGDINIPNGVVFQLFYHNSWYGVVLGEIPKISKKSVKDNKEEVQEFLQIKQSFTFYHDNKKTFFLKQAQLQSKRFKKKYPNSMYIKELEQLK
jgi:hypothetical protein